MTGNNQITVEDIAWCDKLKEDQISAFEDYFNAIKQKFSPSGNSNELDDEDLIDIYRILADRPTDAVNINDATAYSEKDTYPNTANDAEPGKLYLKCHRLKRSTQW
jgi:hypothetical protein